MNNPPVMFNTPSHHRASSTSALMTCVADGEPWPCVDELRDRIERLHSRNSHFPHYCVHCRAPWPCKTLQVLSGS